MARLVPQTTGQYLTGGKASAGHDAPVADATSGASES